MLMDATSPESRPDPLISILQQKISGFEDGTKQTLLPLKRGPSSHRASLVLLGGRGTGKSTLGVIASVSLRRRLVDYEAFQQQTSYPGYDGSDQPSYDAAVLHTLLSAHEENTVIICPIHCCRTPELRSILRAFAKTHPVVYIVSNLEHPDKLGEGAKREQLSYHVGRTCTNYEYYNLLESIAPAISDASRDHQPYAFSPYLNLKRVEEDFLLFLGTIFRLPRRNSLIEPDVDPPSAFRSRFTYALSIYLSDLCATNSLEGILQDGTDAVELKIDAPERTGRAPDSEAFQSICRAITTIRRVFAGPIIYHVERPVARLRSAADATDDHNYLNLLFHGLRLVVDYLTVDLSLTDQAIKNIVSLRGATSIIGHKHYPSSPQDGWHDAARMKQYSRASFIGCQLVRLTQDVDSAQHNFSVLEFAQRAKHTRPRGADLIAYNTSITGKTSQCFNEIYTPVHHPALHSVFNDLSIQHANTSDLTIREAQRSLYASFIYEQTQLYIIGTNVSASLSPAVHRAALEHLGMPHIYNVRNMSSVEELVSVSQSSDFGGASIAQGFKEQLLPYMHSASVHAQIIGAVNTLIPIRCDWPAGEPPPLQFWRERSCTGPVKGLYGENTDWIGLYRCVSKSLSPANAIHPNSTALILGAGGVARGAIYALVQLGVRHVFIYNRTTHRAHTLASYFSGIRSDVSSVTGQTGQGQKPPLPRSRIRVLESRDIAWPDGFAAPTIIISCIRAPPGSNEPAPDLTIPTKWLGSTHGGVIVDTNYEPLISPLVMQMRRVARKGWIVIDGFHILPEQAVAQFELITGRRPPYIRMCIAMMQKYRESYKENLDPAISQLIDLRLKDLYSRLGAAIRID